MWNALLFLLQTFNTQLYVYDSTCSMYHFTVLTLLVSLSPITHSTEIEKSTLLRSQRLLLFCCRFGNAFCFIIAVQIWYDMIQLFCCLCHKECSTMLWNCNRQRISIQKQNYLLHHSLSPSIAFHRLFSTPTFDSKYSNWIESNWFLVACKSICT